MGTLRQFPDRRLKGLCDMTRREVKKSRPDIPPEAVDHYISIASKMTLEQARLVMQRMRNEATNPKRSVRRWMARVKGGIRSPAGMTQGLGKTA